MATFIGLSNWDEIGKPHSSRAISAKHIHQEVLKRTGKEHPRVLYIPTAKEDREDYIDFFRKYYLGLGSSEVDVLRLLKDPPSKKEITDKIFSADAIYVNGGNTHRMLSTWKRLGVYTLLQQAHRQGIVMAGHSAGTVCWFKYVCSDSFYKKQPFKLTGMGVINAVVCPHYDSETVRQPALKKIMKRTPHLVAIALDDDAVIEIVNDTYRILTTVPTAKARRMFWKDGEYVIEEIQQTTAFKDLKALLIKPNKLSSGKKSVRSKTKKS
jgi:dipeptidase E